VGHSTVTLAFRIVAAAAALGIVGPGVARAEDAGGGQSPGQSRPVYQRRAFEGQPGGGKWQGRGHGQWQGGGWQQGGWPHKGGRHYQPHPAPSVQSGWFQRPYPYHLDFYKMKYGGSYAPYFGNLYGPPQVVTAPPYYGPYYGGWGFGGPEGSGQFGGSGGVPVESDPSHPPTPSNNESLPAPAQ
jgi:hypothetical protein